MLVSEGISQNIWYFQDVGKTNDSVNASIIPPRPNPSRPSSNTQKVHTLPYTSPSTTYIISSSSRKTKLHRIHLKIVFHHPIENCFDFRRRTTVAENVRVVHTPCQMSISSFTMTICNYFGRAAKKFQNFFLFGECKQWPFSQPITVTTYIRSTYIKYPEAHTFSLIERWTKRLPKIFSSVFLGGAQKRIYVYLKITSKKLIINQKYIKNAICYAARVKNKVWLEVQNCSPAKPQSNNTWIVTKRIKTIF